MIRRYGFLLVLVVLVGGAAIVMLGEVEQDVSLSSVMEVWGDVLRDADQFGFKLTRVSDREEMEAGREISSKVSVWWRENHEWEGYVTAVGETLLPHIERKGIRYRFHVIEAGQINAFALPGGHIFVTTGMLGFLRSEAELASILGHEISHVDLRHCIERFQYELALKKVGAGEIGHLTEIIRRLLTVGYNKYQELEADAQGIRFSIQAGYDPEAAAAVFNRLKERFGEQTSPKAKTPVEEVAQTLGEAVGEYFQSHPPSEERKRRLNGLIDRKRQRLSGRAFYDGVENYRQRIPRARKEFPGEQHRIRSGEPFRDKNS